MKSIAQEGAEWTSPGGCVAWHRLDVKNGSCDVFRSWMRSFFLFRDLKKFRESVQLENPGQRKRPRNSRNTKRARPLVREVSACASSASRSTLSPWGLWASSPAVALNICLVKATGGAEGSSNYCSLENFEIGLPYMQAPAQESRWLSYCELLVVSCLRFLFTVSDLFFAIGSGLANVLTGPHKVT